MLRKWLSAELFRRATPIGPLARVQSFVTNQVWLCSKGFLTSVTCIGPLSRVPSLMGNQLAFLYKALLADATLIRHLARVQYFMPVQAGLS